MTPKCQLCREPLARARVVEGSRPTLPQCEGDTLPATLWQCVNEKCRASYDGCVATLPASRFP